MERPIIIIFRGHPAGGKTTIYGALKKPLKDFIFIDNGDIKRTLAPLGKKRKGQFVNVKIARQIAKEVLMFYMEKVMEQKGNIAIYEMSGDYVRKRLGPLIRRYHYQVYQFRPHSSLAAVMKRAKSQKRTMSENFLRKAWYGWATGKKAVEKDDIVLDTEKNSLKQCVNMVLKTIGR